MVSGGHLAVIICGLVMDLITEADNQLLSH